MYRFALIFLLAASCCPSFAAGSTFFVSTIGRDAWPGTKQRPFASLERARAAVRELKQSGRMPAEGVTVYVRGGVYLLKSALDLDGADSGPASSPVVYRAYPGERPRLIGGLILPRFRPVSDKAVLNRLDASVRGKVLECDLSALGVRDFGRLASRGFGRPWTPSHLEFFYGGRRMTLARWPNKEFARIAEPGGKTSDDGHGTQIGKLEDGFHYEGDRPSRWKSLDNIWVHGYWSWDWANSYEQVDSIDTSERLVRTKPPYGLYGFRKGQRYFFLNVLEELDESGEYFVDPKGGKLYFLPPTGKLTEEAAVSILAEPLIRARDASHISIRGLVFEYVRGHGIDIKDGEAIRVEGCTVRNVGNVGVLVQDGVHHSVTDCDVYQIGDTGIYLSGGDRKTLVPAGHEAVNNHVYRLSEWSRTYNPAISVNGVGNRVAHNLIHDGPHMGIQLTGNDHTIEFNEIHHVAFETGDVGAFYMGRDWTWRGNVVQYNFFHHTGGVGMGSMGVYLDDCSGGTKVIGNVFYKVTRAMFIGGGRDNTVENNVFVDCKPSVHVDGRGLDPKPVWRNMVVKYMKERLDAMDHHNPPYSTRYPELARLDKYYEAGNGVPPEGNRIAHNIAWKGTWLQINWNAKPEMIDIHDNLVGTDPLFVAPEKLDFRLRPDSPAFRVGFKPIPFEKIGLQPSKYRTAGSLKSTSTR